MELILSICDRLLIYQLTLTLFSVSILTIAVAQLPPPTTLISFKLFSDFDGKLSPFPWV